MAVQKSTSRKSSSTSQKRRTAARKAASKKKTASRTGKGRSKKVILDKNKVSLLGGIIFLICCICLAVNVLSMPSSAPGPAAPSLSQKAQPSAPVKIPEQKKQVQSENDSKKLTAKVASPAEKAPAKTSVKTPAAAPAVSSAPQKKYSVKAEQEKTVKKVSAKDVKPEPVVAKPKPEEKQPFVIPPAKNGATIVLIIDDAGLSVENLKKYTKLPFPLTIAVLPKLNHSKDCAYVVRSAGKELILHQPMQSLNHNLDPGPGKITVDMSFAQIQQIVQENLAEIGPGVKGLNNHEGSEVTEDVLRIGAVLDTCQKNGIYFLDSRTTANTQAPQAALERDMTIFEKAGPYIDNVISRDAMINEIYKSLDFANKNGKAIIIGHVDKSAKILPALLEEMYPYLVKSGYRFATPSML